MIAIDLSDVKETEDYTKLPQGKYISQIQKAIVEIDSKKRVVMTLDFEIKYGHHIQEVVKDNIYITKEDQTPHTFGLGRLKTLHKALGLTNDMKSLDPSIYVGHNLMINIKQDYYTNDKGNTAISSKISPGGFHHQAEWNQEMDEQLFNIPEPEQTASNNESSQASGGYGV